MAAPRRFVILICLPLLCIGAAGAEDGAADEKIAKAVLELGDSSFAVRERASKFLWSAGKTAEPILQEAAKSDDPEVAARAKEILGDFKYGIYPQTPQDVRAIVRSYRRGDLDRRQVVTALTQSQLGRRGYPAL